MNAVLQTAEEGLSVFIVGSIELSVELHHWKNNPHMLEYENNFHRYKEIDLIPRSGKIDAEFMTGLGFLMYDFVTHSYFRCV